MFIFNLFVLALKSPIRGKVNLVIIDVNYTLEVIQWYFQMKCNREVPQEEVWNNSSFERLWTKILWVFLVECSINWATKPHTRSKLRINPLVVIIPWSKTWFISFVAHTIISYLVICDFIAHLFECPTDIWRCRLVLSQILIFFRLLQLWGSLWTSFVIMEGCHK